MMTLREAMEAVQDRHNAAFESMDVPITDGVMLRTATTAEQDKAILSGFDLDYDELVEILDEMAEFFCQISHSVGLHLTFRAAIAEALQIGLVKGADSARD